VSHKLISAADDGKLAVWDLDSERQEVQIDVLYACVCVCAYIIIYRCAESWESNLMKILYCILLVIFAKKYV